MVCITTNKSYDFSSNRGGTCCRFSRDLVRRRRLVLHRLPASKVSVLCGLRDRSAEPDSLTNQQTYSEV
jgi:hypothetical protein